MKLLSKIKWIYCLGKAEVFQTGLKPTENVDTPWGTLDTTGNMCIYPLYAWDGCTPKIVILDWFVIGTPDGPPNCDCLPSMWRPSLMHDWCYQYQPLLSKHGVNRIDVDRALFQMAKKAGAPWIYRWMYYCFVRALGWAWWRS